MPDGHLIARFASLDGFVLAREALTDVEMKGHWCTPFMPFHPTAKVVILVVLDGRERLLEPVVHLSVPKERGLNHVIDIKEMANRDPPPTATQLKKEIVGEP